MILLKKLQIVDYFFCWVGINENENFISVSDVTMFIL